MNRNLSSASGKTIIGLFGLVFILFMTASCSDAVERASETPTPKAPEVPLAVTKTIPSDKAQDISPAAKIVISFSEALDESTFTNDSIKLFSEADLSIDIPLDTTYNNNTGFLQVQNNNQLIANTTHFVLVTTSVKDINGRSIASDYQWAFRTGAEIDVSAPLPNLVSPDLTTPASINTDIVIKFNEVVAPDSITLSLNSTKILDQGTVVSPYTAKYALDSFSVSLPELSPNTEYTVELDATAADLAGNAIPSNVTWAFTTGDSPDITPPILTAQLPNSGTENLLRDIAFQMTFSEPLNQSSVNNNSVYLISQPGDLVTINLQYSASGNTIYIRPSRFLAFNETYFIGLDGLTDLSGNPLKKTFLIYTIELDRDNDGMPNRWEDPYGDLLADADIEVDALGAVIGDGLVNLQEFNYNSNPTMTDTDNDGVTDGAEVAIGRNPTVNEPVLLTIVTSLILSN